MILITNKKNRKRTQLAKIINIGIFLLLLNFMSCKDSECEYDTGCVPSGVNTERAGFTVATCYAADPNGDVAVIYNTQMNSSAPRGDDWGNPTTGTAVTAIHPATWKANIIGQVFGIAIDKNENIYLAASHLYAQGIGPTPAQNTVPAQVYKCTGPTWTATPLFSLPNTGVSTLNGIGNIAYDRINDQLFTTNLEDGKIYRHDTGGTQLGTAFDPWAADVTSPGIVTQDERVWGIGVNYEGNNVKVYFPRVTANSREIYSILLNNDGSFPIAGSEVVEISNVPGSQTVIADLAFSSDTNKMLIAERGNPHAAKVISYTGSGSWTYNLQYFVGSNAFADGENAAGGVDFAYGEKDGDISANCDEFFWSTGNFMDARVVPTIADPNAKIYGLEGIKFSGNNSASTASPNANQDTDLFIDLNGTYNWSDKNSIGDVEVFDADRCFECNN